jgi:serine/threonine-protein kinase RsbW
MDWHQRRVFAGDFASLARIACFVDQAAEAAGLSERAAYAVQMAVDEACSNIIQHAYGGEGIGTIDCTCEVTDESLTITLRDKGRPFDPTLVSDPDLDVQLEERALGGLGVYLIRQLMDTVDHRYEPADGNVLTLVKCREDSS